MAASAVLHLGVAALLFVSWQTAREIEIPPVVPVIIIAGPPGDAAAAAQVEAETPAEAQSPTVAPAPPEAPVPPAPRPEPTPSPPPRPQPRPLPTPPRPAPRTPAKPTPQPAEPELDLDALARNVARSNRPRPSRPAPAPSPGPSRPSAGSVTDLSGADLGALKSKLERLWLLNCTVAGAESIVIKVRIWLGPGGRLSRPAEIVGRSGSAAPEVIQAAADRAVSAVGRGAPYDELPTEKLEGKYITLNFNGRSACRGR